MNMKEIRFTTESELHTQPAARKDRNGPVKLAGYSAVFDALSENLGGFREKIRRGAFADSLKRRDVLALFNHDNGALLGRVRNGSLLLREDRRGLYFEISLPATGLGRDIEQLVADGTLTQMSFGFRAEEDVWSRENGVTIRELLKITLFEISLVPEPAYPQTEVKLRQALELLDGVAAALATRRRRLEELTR